MLHAPQLVMGEGTKNILGADETPPGPCRDVYDRHRRARQRRVRLLLLLLRGILLFAFVLSYAGSTRCCGGS